MSNKHRWVRIFGSLLALVLALGVGLIPVAAQRPAAATPQATYPFFEDTAITKAISYLHTQQLASGGIDAYTFGADPGGTSRLLLALNVVGAPPATFVNTGKSLLNYLGSELVGYIYANDTPGAQNLFPGRAGLALGGVAAGGGDPRNFGGVDLVAALSAAYNAGDGTYSTSAKEGISSGAASPTNQSLAILGLVAAGQPIPAKATQWLIDQQDAAGSWSGSGDVTGYALVALLGSGNVAPTDPAIQQAIAFYRAAQTTKTALWGDASGGESANSTGWALAALSAVGYVPPTASWATGDTNPRAALIGLQKDTGAIGATYVNAYSTSEALYGLADQPLFFATPLRAERALAYIASRQNADGGWPSFGSASSPGETLDNLLAFVAAGYSPSAVKNSGKSPLDYLATAAETYTRDDSSLIFPSQIGKLIVGVVAAGGDPGAFGTPTRDLVSGLQSTIRATGAYSTTAVRGYTNGDPGVTPQSLAILGLRAAGESVPQTAIDYLSGLQGADGGWGGPDSTGLALQALIAAGVASTDQVIVDGVAYLQASQVAGGGWESYGTPNANSIAYAIQGLLAAGVDLNASAWLKNGRSPLGTLASYQKSDGPFAYSWAVGSYNRGVDDLYATQQAVPALLGATYPYTATAPANLSASYTPLLRGPDPDRLLAGSPGIAFNADRTQATLSAPFGGDLDGDATATLEWNIVSGQAQTAAFQTIAATRGDGAFYATLDLSKTLLGASDTLVLRATFSDAGDGVQSGKTISTTPVAVSAEAVPYRQYLQLVRR